MCNMQLSQIWVQLSYVISITEDMQYGLVEENRELLEKWDNIGSY